MTVRIVTHVYAVDLPQYAYFLDAQLWSVEAFAPPGTKISVFCWMNDNLTLGVLNKYYDRVETIYMERGDLFNRAIGRNLAALHQSQDVVWFTDVDHVFGEGCIQSVEEQVTDSDCIMHFPGSLKIHKTHEIGDQCWQRLRDEGYFYLNEDDYIEKVYDRAIGGVQIVPGDFARRYGYLNENRRALVPTTGQKPFPSFRDDIKYRKFCSSKGNTLKIDIPNLYRLRHSKTSYQ